MSLDTLLKRLPSHFKKTPESNNYKLLSIIAEQSNDNQNLYENILRFWDVDQAEGVGLDRLGKEEGLSRGSFDDETYRKLIKIQFIFNMSEGDIESLNAILHAYMGDDFLYLEEGWESFLEEPASLILNVKETAVTIPFSLVRRIKSAGVAIYYVVSMDSYYLVLVGREYTFEVPYPICNTFETDEISGMSVNGNMALDISIYTFDKEYLSCNNFYAGEAF